jgi:predicted unusual protein kinase regulating ubiquinone biosynthesis (AarF/ABC1/UbiB family)
MGRRTERMKRALQVTSVARQRSLLRVLSKLGVVGQRPATREGAVEFRRALEELGKLVDEVPPFPFSEVERIVRESRGSPQGRRSQTSSASTSRTASACPRASLSSARPSPRRTRSRARSIHGSTRSR